MKHTRVLKVPRYGIKIALGPPDITKNQVRYQGGFLESKLDKFLPKSKADVIESLMLAHAIEGINVASVEYVAGLDQCIEAVLNHE